MRVIHCADIHLDSKLSTNLSGAKKRERKAELIRTFEKMVEYAVQNDVSAIIIAGDLFDSKTVSVTPRNAVCKAIINNPDIDFYYLKGNHDVESFLGSLDAIPDNLKLFGDTWTTYTLGPDNKITINGVELNDKNVSSISNTLVLDVDKINIVTLHGQESAYKAKDKTECIPINEFKNKGIDYMALGHVHEYKLDVLDRRGMYCYCGCLEGRGFDECGDHGFVLLDIDLEKGKINTKFIDFATRKMYVIKVDITGCLDNTDIRERIYIDLKRANIDKANFVKVELIGDVDINCDKDIDLLTKAFEDDYFYFRIKDLSRLAINYEDYKLDVSLKGEFVRLVMNDETLDSEKKAEIIRYGIQALAGEEI